VRRQRVFGIWKWGQDKGHRYSNSSNVGAISFMQLAQLNITGSAEML
jgi:hypothetical protein